jgi:hypothetical protein
LLKLQARAAIEDAHVGPASRPGTRDDTGAAVTRLVNEFGRRSKYICYRDLKLRYHKTAAAQKKSHERVNSVKERRGQWPGRPAADCVPTKRDFFAASVSLQGYDGGPILILAAVASKQAAIKEHSQWQLHCLIPDLVAP